MFKYILTAVFLSILTFLLYQPLSLPDDDSMIDRYRPSFKLQSTTNNADQSDNNNTKLATFDFQRDTISTKGGQILVDSTP